MKGMIEWLDGVHRIVCPVLGAVLLLVGAVVACTPEGAAYLDARREDVRRQCASSLTPQVQELCRRLGLPPQGN